MKIENIKISWFLPVRRYASTSTSYGPLSVCLPVRHKSVFYQKGWTDRAGFSQKGFLRPTKFKHLQNKRTSPWNFVLNSWL